MRGHGAFDQRSLDALLAFSLTLVRRRVRTVLERSAWQQSTALTAAKDWRQH